MVAYNGNVQKVWAGKGGVGLDRSSICYLVKDLTIRSNLLNLFN